MYYVFVGQLNTTSGRPHPTTGRYSIYGDLLAFSTRKQRDEFYNNFYSSNVFESCVKTNKNSARSRFFRGMTQIEFDDYLSYVANNMIAN